MTLEAAEYAQIRNMHHVPHGGAKENRCQAGSTLIQFLIAPVFRNSPE